MRLALDGWPKAEERTSNPETRVRWVNAFYARLNLISGGFRVPSRKLSWALQRGGSAPSPGTLPMFVPFPSQGLTVLLLPLYTQHYARVKAGWVLWPEEGVSSRNIGAQQACPGSDLNDPSERERSGREEYL